MCFFRENYLKSCPKNHFSVPLGLICNFCKVFADETIYTAPQHFWVNKAITARVLNFSERLQKMFNSKSFWNYPLFRQVLLVFPLNKNKNVFFLQSLLLLKRFLTVAWWTCGMTLTLRKFCTKHSAPLFFLPFPQISWHGQKSFKARQYLNAHCSWQDKLFQINWEKFGLDFCRKNPMSSISWHFSTETTWKFVRKLPLSWLLCSCGTYERSLRNFKLGFYYCFLLAWNNRKVQQTSRQPNVYLTLAFSAGKMRFR